MNRILLAVCALLLFGCGSQPAPPAPPPDVGILSMPADPGAGLLTLPDGNQFNIRPQDLNFTGVGVYEWPDGRRYNGQWQHGRPQGAGEMRLPSGEVYQGLWQDGIRHGHGELVFADDARYVGNFDKGRRSGQGVLTDAGGLYRGGWLNDLPHGQGEFMGNDGSRYRGEYDHGQRQGQGELLDPAGNRYVGAWRADQPAGEGTLFAAGGGQYQGQWAAGQRSGYGVWIGPSGLRYEGTWAAGLRTGFGRETRPDGSSYQGDWEANERHGKGREQSADGRFHDGTWVTDYVLGPGTRRLDSGIEISGLWTRDSIRQGLVQLPSGAEYAGTLYLDRGRKLAPGYVDWMTGLAQSGDPHAQYLLGTRYLDYAEPAPDPKFAQSWFDRAARGGVAEAQYRAAELRLGTDPQRAVSQLRAAAGQGHVKANLVLAGFHRAGSHVEQSNTAAVEFLETAARLGSHQARVQLAELLLDTTDPELHDPQRAVAVIEPLALWQRDWDYLALLARAHAAAGNTEAAAAIAEQVRSAVEALGSATVPAAPPAALDDIRDQLSTTPPIYGTPAREPTASERSDERPPEPPAF